MNDWRCFVIGVGLSIASATPQAADEPSAKAAARGLQLPAGASAEVETVYYAADFFARYQPLTALDMVRQVPGFQLDDGDNLRGFGGAAGNILINDRRPSAKQDPPSAILARIPASQVRGVDLIRGQVRGLDLQGHAVIANVLLRADVPATIRWEAYIRYNNMGPWKPGTTFSISDHWSGIDYNAGVGIEREASGLEGTESVFVVGNDLTELRFDDSWETGHRLTGNVNASTWWRDNLVQLNTRLWQRYNDELLQSRRIPQQAGSEIRDVFFRPVQTTTELEIGADAERSLGQKLLGKAIVLYIRGQTDFDSSRRDVDAAGEETRVQTVASRTVESEAIARLEFDWSGWTDHSVQVNLEGAFNALDGSLEQTEDTGSGPVLVDVPGSNTRVEEVRGNVLIKDTWSLGRWTLDYGLGTEASTITQSGDAELDRSFFFLKPQVLVTWAPEQAEQTRLTVAREVAQLDFKDFVSATVFQDDDLALGNPDLKPEATWIAELSHERRFGELGVVTLTGFHHWISDVQDLLPLTDEFEAPGNIGDGQRWGLMLEGTLPLERLGLTGARLDLQARWQRSAVTDPVTLEERILSSSGGFRGPPVIRFNTDNEYIYDIAYRQDFDAAQVAWGWDIAEQAQRPLYKVNELDVYDEGVELNAFVETTRWWGIKLRLEGNNLLNFDEIRERTIYAGERSLTPLERRLLQLRNSGRRITVSLSGSF